MLWIISFVLFFTSLHVTVSTKIISRTDIQTEIGASVTLSYHADKNTLCDIMWFEVLYETGASSLHLNLIGRTYFKDKNYINEIELKYQNKGFTITLLPGCGSNLIIPHLESSDVSIYMISDDIMYTLHSFILNVEVCKISCFNFFI